MKTDFSINVQVNIGVTPEVVQLVTAILTKQPTAVVVPATSSEQPANTDAPTPAPAKKGRKGKAAEAEAPANEPEPEPQPGAEAPTPEPETPANAPEPEPKAEAKELTEQDIRDAMDRTRKRIEGEDYKNNTTSELYTKYHKVLTATFKNIASLLGSEKPSQLPAEKRAEFIAECDALKVQQDGTISKDLAF